jgi:hypothetical protein
MFAVSEFPVREAVRGRGALRAVRGSLVTGNYFQTLGVDARLGRTFTSRDRSRPRRPPDAVISDAFWEREFARSPAALGQSIEINQAAATIIGVAPPEFFGETVGNAPDVWLPIAVQPRVMPSDWLNAPSSSWLAVLARLHPGVSPRQAEQALAVSIARSPSLAARRRPPVPRVAV